ncbi:AraC family transcriptional regulator [Paracoccus sp. S3-43]|uniref:helix-turn-helix domain-containing protein n=1 Tax=Paracoccus sp. S3-43 TaxID=3030011 RepID=UPI0023AF0860|nr:AraC family transcriptional regulator [Paracoccus sp. S3-43]WEF22945.1 AraC family transcriptional regulator [Paracoccus sp. S3-43]
MTDSDVNAPGIPDAADAAPDRPAVVTPTPAAAPAALRPALRKGRPIGRQQGMRLLPLQAFIWGSRAMPPQPRTRPDHTLIWVTEGRMQLDFPRSHVILRAGDLRHIPAGTAFAAMPAPGTLGHVALISARLAARAEPPLPDRGMAAHVGSHAAQLEATLHELAMETADPDAGTLSCLLNLLSLRLGQLQPGRPPEQAAGAAPDLPLIEAFLALAVQRLGSAGSVAELAADLNSTMGALDQACLAARGKRAVELIHDLQLERAVDLLRGTRRPTLRIAADLGYSSHAHFIRAFVAATGRTPDAFRAQSC